MINKIKPGIRFNSLQESISLFRYKYYLIREEELEISRKNFTLITHCKIQSCDTIVINKYIIIIIYNIIIIITLYNNYI